MKCYEITFLPQAEKEFDDLDPKMRRMVARHIDGPSLRTIRRARVACEHRLRLAAQHAHRLGPHPARPHEPHETSRMGQHGASSSQRQPWLAAALLDIGPGGAAWRDINVARLQAVARRHRRPGAASQSGV